MTQADPKPGRWILPLIIVGMVVLTYAFVNSIEPAESPTGSAPNGATTTVPTDTTTSLPAEFAQFMVQLGIFESQINGFATEVSQVNSRWEDRAASGVTFAQTRTSFLNIQTQLRNFETEVLQAEVPAELVPGHVDLLNEVSVLPEKMEDIILGLDAPDDGTARRAAVIAFQAQIDQVLEALDAIRRTAQGEEPVETETTLPGDANGNGDEEQEETPEG